MTTPTHGATVTPELALRRLTDHKASLLAAREDLHRQLDSVESQLYLVESVLSPDIPPDDIPDTHDPLSPGVL